MQNTLKQYDKAAIEKKISENTTKKCIIKKITLHQIGVDQQEPGETLLSLGHSDINQVEMITSTTLLLMGHSHINQVCVNIKISCKLSSHRIRLSTHHSKSTASYTQISINSATDQ